MSIKDGYTVFTFFPTNAGMMNKFSFFCYHTKLSHYIGTDEERLDSLLPISEGNKDLIKMLFPTINVEHLEAALRDWDDFDPQLESLYGWSPQKGWL